MEIRIEDIWTPPVPRPPLAQRRGRREAVLRHRRPGVSGPRPLQREQEAGAPAARPRHPVLLLGSRQARFPEVRGRDAGAWALSRRTRSRQARSACTCTRPTPSAATGFRSAFPGSSSTPPAPARRAARSRRRRGRRSGGWRVLRDSAELAAPLEGVRTVAVLDREGDAVEVFAEQRNLGGDIDLLVRARHDRSLGRKKRSLFERIRRSPVRGRVAVRVEPASARNSARRAWRTATCAGRRWIFRCRRGSAGGSAPSRSG